MIEEAEARAHTLPRARRLESPANHPAMFSPWQRAFKTHWASMCCYEKVEASSAVSVQDVNTATEGHPGRAQKYTV